MIQCKQCYVQNDEDAMFCKKCGETVSVFAIKPSNKSQVILTIIGFFLVFQSLFLGLMYQLLGYSFGEVISYFSSFVSFLAVCLPILIAIFIKNKGVKITLFILGGIMVLRFLYLSIVGYGYYY